MGAVQKIKSLWLRNNFRTMSTTPLAEWNRLMTGLGQSSTGAAKRWPFFGVMTMVERVGFNTITIGIESMNHACVCVSENGVHP